MSTICCLFLPIRAAATGWVLFAPRSFHLHFNVVQSATRRDGMKHSQSVKEVARMRRDYCLNVVFRLYRDWNDVLREVETRVCIKLLSPKCNPQHPSINKLAKNGRPRKIERDRGKELEWEKRIINKSLISWVFFAPSSHWAGGNTHTHAHASTYSRLQVWPYYIDCYWEETDLLQRRPVFQMRWQQSSSPRAKAGGTRWQTCFLTFP